MTTFRPSSKDQAANRPRRVDIRNRRSIRKGRRWVVEARVERVAHVRVDGIAWRIPEHITGEHMCRASDGEHWRQLSPRPEMLENVPAGGSRVEGRSRQLAVAVACMHVPRGRYVNTRGRRRGDEEGARHDERVAVRPAFPLLRLFSLARELA